MSVAPASPRITRPAVVKAVVALAVIAFAFALPYVVSEYYVGVATLVLVSAILAASINLLAGDGGLVSLGHAGISMAAGYGIAWSVKEELPFGVQLLVSLGVTLVVSAVFGLATMRMRGVFYLMITVALGMICWGIAQKWSVVTGGDNGLSRNWPPEAIRPYWTYYFVVLAIFLLATLALWVISRSPFGLVLRGIRDSESRMRSLGYRIASYKFAAMMLSGLFAGLAGVLMVWRTGFINPKSGDFIASALPLIMVVLGGLGTALGPLVGAVIVVLISQVLSSYVDRWQTVLGLLFIASVILAPRGLVGGVRSLAARVGGRIGGRRPPAPETPATTE